MRQVYVDNLHNDISRIDFISPSKGYVSFKNWIGFTADSGRTFTKKFITLNNVDFGNYNGINLLFGFAINGVQAISQDTIVVYGDYGFEPSILYSTNGGNSFKLVYYIGLSITPPLSGAITDVIFPQNNSIGYAINAYKILKTTNKGLDWSTIFNNGNTMIALLDAIDNNNVFAYNSTQLFRTSNAGSTWQQINLPAGAITRLDFITVNKGWIYMDDGTQKYFYYTSNGGTTWTQIDNSAVPFTSLSRLKFTNDSTGYAFEGGWTTYKSTDSGKIWEPLARDNNYSGNFFGFFDIQCLNNNQLWVGGGNGFMELTTNGGGTPLPKAYFKIDTTNLFITNTVNLYNYSKKNYQYKWYKNGALISTAYNTSYIHNASVAIDTIKLVTLNGITTDTLIKYQSFHVILPPAPIISSFTPVTATTGTIITISGYNFSGTTTVSFGGIAATSFTIVSPAAITAVVGSGATGSVSMTNSYGTGIKTGFTYIPPPPPPTITSFTPATGANGTVITITGTNFTSPASVSVGGVFVSASTIISTNTITATLSNGATGNVQVTTSAGTASLPGFTYYPIPTVTSVTPNIGISGIPVIITGTGFTGATSVTIGGVAVTSFIVISATSISATVGNGATGIVTVTNPINSSNSNIIFSFTNAPFITSFSPISGPIGTTVTISGSNFSPLVSENIVNFGSVKATVLSSANNSIVVQVPAGATYQPISVTRPLIHLSGYSSSPFNVTFPSDPAAFNASSFVDKIDLQTGNNPYEVAIGDIDGDGKSDLVTANILSGTVSVFRNTSTPSQISFAARIDLPMAASITRVQLSDIDGDGKADIIFSTGSAGSPLVGISIVRNLSVPGNISFGAIKTISNPVYHNFFVIGDFNLDGKPDIASAPDNTSLVAPPGGNNGGAFMNVYKNISANGTIDFTGPQYFGLNISGASSGSEFSEMRISDINNDGKTDIVLGNTANNFFIIFENTSTYTSLSFSAREIIHNNTGGTISPVIADFDADGKKDILTTQAIAKNVADFTFSFLPPPPGTNSSLGNNFCDDLNGDGKPDFGSTSSNFIAGSSIVGIALSKNIGTPNNILFAPAVNYPVIGTGPISGVTISGDLDGDGKPEIIFTQTYRNLLSILKNTIGITQVCAGSSTSFTTNITGVSYQWQADTGSGFSDISNNANYSGINTINLQLNNIPSSWSGYNFRCVINNALFSNVYSIAVIGVNSSVSISAATNTICTGTPVIFAATPVNGGSNPSYQWQVNGINAGTNSNTFTTSTLNNNAQVKVILTSNSACTSGTTSASNVITMNVGGTVSPSVSITSSNTSVCIGAPVTFSATPVSGGANPSYQWQVNNINAGTNSNTFTTSSLNNNDQVKVTLTSSLSCASPVTVVSNVITISITAVPVSNAGSDTTICAGTNAQLHGSGGVTYSWSPASGISNVNISNPVASPAVTTTYVLTVTNGSNCSSKDTVIVTVNQPASVPSVTITSLNNNICFGTSTTFTAVVTNGGINPTYQWQVNAVNMGTNNNVFTSNTLNDNDKVKSIVTGHSACTVNNTVISNIITMNVQQLAIPVLSLNNRVLTVTNPDAAATYFWQTQTNNIWGDVIPAAMGITYSATVSGGYRVKAIKGSCINYSVSQATNSIIVRPPSNNPFGIYLYPSPTNGIITLDSISLSQNWETLIITNAAGSHVLPELNIKNQTTVSVNVAMLNNGIYFAVLRKRDGGYTTIKFVKQ